MNDVFLYAVVNGEREALGKATAMTIRLDGFRHTGEENQYLRTSSLGSRPLDRPPGLHRSGSPVSNRPGLRPGS